LPETRLPLQRQKDDPGRKKQLMGIERFSSRRQRLDHSFLKVRLRGGKVL
jgi:hypothetical protein